MKKQTPAFKNSRVALLVAASCLMLPAHAAVTAGFDGGNGTTSYDQYTGIAGGGWSSAWGLSASVGTPTITVASAAPIAGSGNYLSATFNGAGDTNFGRQYYNDGTNGGVDASQAITYTFDYRVDSLTGWGSNSDYLTIAANQGGTYGAGGGSSFIIRAHGAATGGAGANTWSFYNGNKDKGTFDANKFVNSGMTLAAGTTYFFTIISDPTTKTYTATIFDGTNTVSSGAMGWRGSDGTAISNIGFNGRVSTGGGDSFGVSIDNISISAVPEPGTYGLIGAGALATLALARRRRKA